MLPFLQTTVRQIFWILKLMWVLGYLLFTPLKLIIPIILLPLKFQTYIRLPPSKLLKPYIQCTNTPQKKKLERLCLLLPLNF